MKTDGQKKILITGASGFIGGFLVKEALNRGYEVWAGVRAGSNLSNLNDKRIKFICKALKKCYNSSAATCTLGIDFTA